MKTGILESINFIPSSPRPRDTVAGVMGVSRSWQHVTPGQASPIGGQWIVILCGISHGYLAADNRDGCSAAAPLATPRGNMAVMRNNGGSPEADDHSLFRRHSVVSRQRRTRQTYQSHSVSRWHYW